MARKLRCWNGRSMSGDKAQAEAKSLSLQRDVITPNLIRLREIEALTKAIEKWNGTLPSTVLGGGANTLLNIKEKGE
jgi:hypothetical protein